MGNTSALYHTFSCMHLDAAAPLPLTVPCILAEHSRGESSQVLKKANTRAAATSSASSAP